MFKSGMFLPGLKPIKQKFEEGQEKIKNVMRNINCSPLRNRFQTSAFQDPGSQRFREPIWRLTQITLEVLHNRLREGQGLSLVDDVLFIQTLGNHHLSQITNHFGGRGDLK
jgi:hypothetical protein